MKDLLYSIVITAPVFHFEMSGFPVFMPKKRYRKFVICDTSQSRMCPYVASTFPVPAIQSCTTFLRPVPGVPELPSPCGNTCNPITPSHQQPQTNKNIHRTNKHTTPCPERPHIDLRITRCANFQFTFLERQAVRALPKAAQVKLKCSLPLP